MSRSEKAVIIIFTALLLAAIIGTYAIAAALTQFFMSLMAAA